MDVTIDTAEASYGIASRFGYPTSACALRVTTLYDQSGEKRMEHYETPALAATARHSSGVLTEQDLKRREQW